VSLRAPTRAQRSTSPSGRVEGGERVEGLPDAHRSREKPVRGLFGERARSSRDRGRFGGPGSGERWFEHHLFGVEVRARARPRIGSRSNSIRLVGVPRSSSEVRGTSTVGIEGAPQVSDVSAALATGPFGVVRQDGDQTTEPVGSMRAEGAGHTLEADQGHERRPNRLTATRQPGRRTPRRVRDVTMSRHEAHGGSAQPIRR
jgi:hypothetical protein